MGIEINIFRGFCSAALIYDCLQLISLKVCHGNCDNGFRVNCSICHIIVHYGATCCSLNKPCFVSHLVSTIRWLHWRWVCSAPGSGKSVWVHMNKHSGECHKTVTTMGKTLSMNVWYRHHQETSAFNDNKQKCFASIGLVSCVLSVILFHFQ